MLRPVFSAQFKRDRKRMIRRGKDAGKLKRVITWLANEEPLPDVCCDHALVGKWSSYRDCHIEPDWILIYQTTDEELRLARTGSHSDLF